MSAEQSRERRTCHFSGHVQGVGFRYTAHNIATRHDVTGYVRNLPNGQVELVMEGPGSEMDQVLDAIKQRMEGFIRKTNVQASPATGEFKDFSVRH
jgi:acylphosphatase